MAGLIQIIDAEASEHLSDRRGCEALVRLIADRTGMTILSLTGYHLKIGNGPGYGVSVTALTAEGHIAARAWPEYSRVHFTMDSCRAFNYENVTDVLKDFFLFTRITKNQVTERWGPE